MDRVRSILMHYAGEPPGVLEKLYRMMNAGKLAGTGKMVILPVDQGMEHGAAASFGGNPSAYAPHYHYNLAITAGCSAYAAPPGFLAAGAAEFAGQIPLVLKLNGSDSQYKEKDPCPALTSSVDEAVRLGCVAIGLTVYPGSSRWNEMAGMARELIAEARDKGLPTVMWAYPRGSGIATEDETALPIVANAAHTACQLGAHIIKVKPPTAVHAKMKDAYDKMEIKDEELSDRVRHVIQAAFAGQRIVIFSGGPEKGEEEFLQETQQLREGGSFGAIVGRNAFKRPFDDGVKLLQGVMGIYAGE